MLERLVELSLRYKVLVLIAFAVIGLLGVQAARQLPIDAFPDVTPVQVNVYTEASGLAAEDVEQLLTTPVESALAGLPRVEQIRSVSLFGLSYVAVYFGDGMDIYFARQLVNERLQQVGDRLPAGYGKPDANEMSTDEAIDQGLTKAVKDFDSRFPPDWRLSKQGRAASE